MYLGGPLGRFRQPAFGSQVARSGWTWGTSTLDFDSDGDMDIYVANGNESRKTARDYCTRFWCHDIYMTGSRPDPVRQRFFEELRRKILKEGTSWNGFEHNHLFMNRSGKGFLNVAFLFGVAFEFDARSVIGEDLDADGKPDLLVLETRPDETDSRRYLERLHVLKNHWPADNHWIGVRLLEESGGVSPLGATVHVVTPKARYVACFTSGDSFMAQHAPVRHFGLGRSAQVDYIEVRWSNGTKMRLTNPAVDRYHYMRPNRPRGQE